MSNTFNIHGASLLGVLCCFEIKKKYPEAEVNLIEKSNQILSAWQPINIQGIKLNPGAHAIELPRAARTFELMAQHLAPETICYFEHNTHLFLDGFCFKFLDDVSGLDEPLKLEFERLLNGKKWLKLNYQELEKFLVSNLDTQLNKTLRKCSLRYGEDFSVSLGALYPWFFPANFLFATQGEGADFYNAMRTGKIIGQFAQPSSGLMVEWAIFLEAGLRKIGVNILYGEERETRWLGHEANVFDIWCAPAHLLLQDKSLFFNALENKRDYVLALYKIDVISQFANENFFNVKIKEVLFAHTEAPFLNKVSLIERQGQAYLCAEVTLHDYRHFGPASFESLGKIIEKTMRINLSFIDSKFLRNTYSLNEKQYIEADKRLIDDYGANLVIGNRRWGPQNMSRVGPTLDNMIENL